MTFIAGFLPSFVKSRKSELEGLVKVEIIDKRRAAPVTDRSPFSFVLRLLYQECYGARKPR
jgi:hypothetical protein